ncbi:MAG: metallophosphatase [Flavobacteriales bacterium]|nr:MAG: metallophosphatase [Flavobacteriales bacterium]
MSLYFILAGVLIILPIDFYYYRAVKKITENFTPPIRKTIKISYWLFTIATLVFMLFVASYFNSNEVPPKFARVYLFGIILIILLSKLIGCVFIILHDFKSLILFASHKLLHQKTKIYSPSRRQFLKKSAIIASIIPFGALMYGVVKSAFDYTIHYQKLKISRLPNVFKGLKIIQISDIHSGSFLSDDPLKEVVQIIKEQQPDIIFFTGDLVNEITEEAIPFIDTLKQISAPMGVYSILGNHDYGDYFYQKNDLEGKKHNYKLMKALHKKLGWKLLLNEHHIIKRNNERLAIIGVENWGSQARFQKYGDINKAKKGCLDNDIKLLLSHDPSHWEMEVIPYHPDIDVTFSGHTHGMQFGIEIPGFIKWSPSQYLYKNWAGLYNKENQQIYVNRGIGFIGYPGRVGILPEITVFELS